MLTAANAPDRFAVGLATSTAYALPPGTKLNLGCGPVQPAGWVNIDGSNRARLAAWLPWVDRALVHAGALPATAFGPQIRVRDLRRGLPFADGSAAAIYAGELWEHFEVPDAERLTRECHRVLAPGGVLRICVPDGVQFWGRYLELVTAGDPDAVARHVAMFFGEIPTRPLRPFGSWGHTHKWQWDEVQLAALFRRAGFGEVARAHFHVSRIPDVAAVERSDFCIIEGVRP